MDRRITVRYYQIETTGDAGRSFWESLQAAHHEQMPNREIGVGDGIVMRLEHLAQERDLVVGDFTRVQTDNLPSHATQQSSDPLPVDRLGHHTAFCFDTRSKILALQFDMKMGVGRICRYAAAFSQGKSFAYLPVLKEGALEQFDNETPTKLKVRVAKVEKFSDFNAEFTDFERGIEQMGALFDSPVVEITLSSRGRDGGLDKDTVGQTVRRLLGLRERFKGIRSIIAETDETPDPFNFIKDLLRKTEVLDLPANEPVVARNVRIDFARRCINDQLGYIRATYAAGEAL